MATASKLSEFLVPDGTNHSLEERLIAARKNQRNDQRLRRLDALLDEGKSYADAARIVNEELPLEESR